MGFHNQPFPLELSALSPQSTWKTQITELGGGGEQRAILFADALRQYDASTPTLTLAQFRQIENHFNARRGQGFAFPLRDRSAFKITTAEGFGTGTGAATQFQLTINSGDATNAYNKEIFLPESGTIRVFDGVTELVEGSGAGKFEVAYSGSSGGVVTFGTAPISGNALTWIGQYYVPVRYAVDSLPEAELFLWRSDNTGLVQGPSIPLREVRYAAEF